MMFFRKPVPTFRHHALFARFFRRPEPMLTEAGARDAAALAALHGASFGRGWSEDEFERLLVDRSVLAHRAILRHRLVGFIISRIAAGEAEILSVAVARAQQGRGLARRLLDLHLRRLAGLGVRTVFLEVDDDNVAARRLYARSAFRQVGRRDGYYVRPGNASSAALVLRRDLG
jgi:[ribosomal protein S18]-alanine N-acetyltransferase